MQHWGYGCCRHLLNAIAPGVKQTHCGGGYSDKKIDRRSGETVDPIVSDPVVKNSALPSSPNPFRADPLRSAP